MAIPGNVRRQGERAEAIRKKVYEEGKTPAELGVKSTPPPGEAPPTDPDPAIPAGDNLEPTGEAPAEDYKVKYQEALHQISVLKGKIDSEVPDLISNNRMMAGQLATLQATISDLQTKLTKPAEQPAAPKTDPQEATDLQAYQDNFPEIHRGQLIVMKQWAKSEEFRGMVHAIVEEVVKGDVEPRVARVENEVKTSREDTFGSKMDRLVKDANGRPCWKDINDNKEFTQWLKDSKYGGFSKFELLRAALGKGDADAVAEFFTDWQKIKNPPATPAKDTPVVGDESVAPARPGSTVVKKPGNGEEKKTFTRSFVKKFHTDVALGRFKNKPKDRDRITAEINEAMTKGLIVNG